MTLDDWLAHYQAQAGYTIEIRHHDGIDHYVVKDEDGVIVDWRPVNS